MSPTARSSSASTTVCSTRALTASSISTGAVARVRPRQRQRGALARTGHRSRLWTRARLYARVRRPGQIPDLCGFDELRSNYAPTRTRRHTTASGRNFLTLPRTGSSPSFRRSSTSAGNFRALSPTTGLAQLRSSAALSPRRRRRSRRSSTTSSPTTFRIPECRSGHRSARPTRADSATTSVRNGSSWSAPARPTRPASSRSEC